MLIAKKYFLFHGLNTKKAGLKRIRIAKKNHSSLLVHCHCFALKTNKAYRKAGFSLFISCLHHLRISGASHLGIFDQPGGNEFFNRLLILDFGLEG
jgi:hypothetical protein